MSDRELLELAAKAAGYEVDEDCDRVDIRENWGAPVRWRPLEDDGDAFRLAVRIQPHKLFDFITFAEPAEMGEEAFAEMRRAVVCAAAEIGRAMP